MGGDILARDQPVIGASAGDPCRMRFCTLVNRADAAAEFRTVAVPILLTARRTDDVAVRRGAARWLVAEGGIQTNPVQNREHGRYSELRRR